MDTLSLWIGIFFLTSATVVAVWTIDVTIDNWLWKRRHWMAHPKRWWEK